jgi:hypothetical protein
MLHFSKVAAVLVLFCPLLYAEIEQPHSIAMEIKILCPSSEEFSSFAGSIPEQGEYVTYEEWKNSFVNNFTQLLNLIESGKIYNASWSVKTDDHALAQTKE